MQSKLQRILNPSVELLKFSIGAARQQSEASVLLTSPGIRGPDRGSVWLRLAPTALQSVPYWPNSCTGLRHGPLPPPCHTQQPLSQAQKSPWQRGIRQPPALFFPLSAQHFITKDAPPTGFTRRMPTSIRELYNRSVRKGGGASLKARKSGCQSPHMLL